MAAKPQTIVYKTVNNLDIPLDLFLPENASNAPILLWFHGGGLLQGRRERYAPHMINGVSKYGYALVSADYRLAPQVGVEEIFKDVKDCVTFIRSKNGLCKHVTDGVLDTTRLAVSGSSAGGYLAFLAGLYVEPKPRAILPIYPITDPLGTFFITPQPNPSGGDPIARSTLAEYLDLQAPASANSDSESNRRLMYFYMLQEANLAELLKLDPALPSSDNVANDKWRISKSVYQHKLPPTYVVHGDADRAVGVEQADEVVGVMLGCGMTIGETLEYERIRGVDHLFDADAKWTLHGMYEFMMKHL